MRQRFRSANNLAFGLLWLLSSCVSMGKITIQVPVPPTHQLSNDIQSIVLMNRSMNGMFSSLDQDSLENLLVRKKLVLDEQLLDSLAADSSLKIAGNAMYESGRFDIVIPVKRNLSNWNSIANDKMPTLPLPQVNQICNEFKTDGLLVMEKFSEKVNSSYQVGYDRMTDYGLTKSYTIFLQIAFQSNWKLYQPGEKLKTAQFEVKDTIYWERNGNTLQEAYEQLPTIKEAIMDGAIENGKGIANYFAPGWKSQVRHYFITDNKIADQAIVHLKNNNWAEAEKQWLKFADTPSRNLRSQIEYNLALAAEMEGKPVQAIDWIKKSIHSRYSKVGEDYLKILSEQQPAIN